MKKLQNLNYLVLLLLITVTIDSLAQDLTTGLISVWELDETSGNTVTASYGTNATNHGAIVNQTGKINKAYLFDGTQSYVDAGTIPAMTLTNNFTWSFWVYLNSGNSSMSVILGNRYGGTGDVEFIKFTPDDFDYYNGNTGSYWLVYTIPTNTWSYLTATKEGASLKYYVNGIQVRSTTISSTISLVPLYFGGDALGEYTSCKIDQVAIWNKALTPTEIGSLYNNGSGLAYSLWGGTPTALLGGSIYLANTTITSGQIPGLITSTQLASGGNCGTSYSYNWKSSTNGGLNWSASLGTQVTYQPGALTQSTMFKREVTCGTTTESSNIISINVTSSGGGEVTSVNGQTGDVSLNLSSTSSANNRTISISDGIGTTINVADSDDNPVNELQSLSLSGNQLTISNGNTVPLPGVTSIYTGTGLTSSGSTGSVTLSAQTTSAIWNANQLYGRAVLNTPPISGQVLKWNGSTWAPSEDISGTGGTSLWGTISGTDIGYTLGNVNIGNSTTTRELHVNGIVYSKEVIVQTSIPTPDYVFQKDYQLKPLSEVEDFIKQNSHLPEIPSAKQVEENGIDLGKMNMLLLKKVEELTLYVLEQEKRIKELEKNTKY